MFLHTGGDAADLFLQAFPHAVETLEMHAGWGHWACLLAIAASVLCVFTLLTPKWPMVAKVFRVLACAVALLVSYYIYNTGHIGAQMVYYDALKIGTKQPIKAAPFTVKQ